MSFSQYHQPLLRKKLRLQIWNSYALQRGGRCGRSALCCTRAQPSQGARKDAAHGPAALCPKPVQLLHETDQVLKVRLRRRNVSFTALLAAVFSTAQTKESLALTDHNVRLEDVSVPEIRAGVRAAARGDFDTAKEYFEALTRNMPDSASAWSNLANAELSQGKLEDALDHFTTAVQLAPDAPVPYLNRAIAKEALGSRLQMQGNSKEAQGLFLSAVDDCNRSIQLDTNEFAAYYNKANVLARLEDYYGALQEYTTAADLAPGIAGYRFKQAIMAYQVGEDRTAKALLRGLGRKYPVYSEAKVALSAILWAEGEAASAENQYIDAFSRDPRVGDLEYIRTLFWTPRLLGAMEDFLHIEFRKP